MHSETEHLIWDKIVNSARQRININDYGEAAAAIDGEVLDKMILHIIAAFASGEDHCTISTNLYNELKHIGVHVYEETVDRIIEDKHIVFSAEIYATYLTFSLLESGYSEEDVMDSVNDLLDAPKIH